MGTIGSRVRDARKQKGLTMKQLHDMTGLSTGNICDIEKDRYTPSAAALLPLSKALDRSIEWILEGEDAVQNSEPLKCDGVPLSMVEADLVAMFRDLKASEKEIAFQFVTMLYQRKTGGVASDFSGAFEDEKSAPA